MRLIASDAQNTGEQSRTPLVVVAGSEKVPDGTGRSWRGHPVVDPVMQVTGEREVQMDETSATEV
jgi:hypothetical protein